MIAAGPIDKRSRKDRLYISVRYVALGHAAALIWSKNRLPVHRARMLRNAEGKCKGLSEVVRRPRCGRALGRIA
jgi:hypothetical protein